MHLSGYLHCVQKAGAQVLLFKDTFGITQDHLM